MEIYANVNISPLTIFKTFSGVPISPITSKALWHTCGDHIQLWAVDVCKLPSQTKVAIMRTNIRPETLANIVRFSCLPGVSQGAIWNHLPCVWEQQSYPGTTWAFDKDDHIEWRLCLFSVSRSERVFSQRPGSGADDQEKQTSCLCPHGPGAFSSSWISLKTSTPMRLTDSWSSLPPWPPHVDRQALKLEPSALVSCDILGCNNPLTFQQHKERLGHAYYSCSSWLWNHQQIAHGTWGPSQYKDAVLPV